MTLKERVEENIALWLLGSLLTGFLSGIATYRVVQEIAGLEPKSKSGYEALQQKLSESEARASQLQSELDRRNKEPIQTDFPQLRGVQVGVVFPDRLAPRAIEVKAKLEKLGMTVKLIHSEIAPASKETVYYYKNGYASAAVTLTQVLKDYGYQYTKFVDSIGSYDLWVEL